MKLGQLGEGHWRKSVVDALSRFQTTFKDRYRQNPPLYGLSAIVSILIGLWLALLLLQTLWLLISTPFDFLADRAGFDINQSLIAYQDSASYGRAFLVGLGNTLLVSALAIVFATLVGFMVGIARLSSNWLVAKMAMAYIEIIRNIPLLLQLFFWYFAVLRSLPHPRKSYEFFELFFINKRGVFIPKLVFEPAMLWVFMAVFLSVVAAFFLYRKNKQTREQTGHKLLNYWRWLAGIIALPFAVFLLAGLPLSFDVPSLGRFNLRGGLQILPEFLALLLALSLYTASYIAEIIRSGIIAVNKGQNEAAAALGLSHSKALQLVIIPQAMRIIIPPLTNQYMNTIKNSSLAVAIGYPDLVHISMGATLSQTGKAVELVFLVMAVYLFLSLLTSFFMGWFNDKVALKER